jgi:hypothetical protein
MALPMKQAADLAKVMADKGVPGSITMAKPMGEKEMPEMHEDKEDGLHAVCDELADAIADGDEAKKSQVMSLLGELVDRLKSEDKEPDEEDMGSEEDSY